MLIIQVRKTFYFISWHKKLTKVWASITFWIMKKIRGLFLCWEDIDTFGFLAPQSCQTLTLFLGHPVLIIWIKRKNIKWVKSFTYISTESFLQSTHLIENYTKGPKHNNRIYLLFKAINYSIKYYPNQIISVLNQEHEKPR